MKYDYIGSYSNHIETLKGFEAWHEYSLDTLFITPKNYPLKCEFFSRRVAFPKDDQKVFAIIPCRTSATFVRHVDVVARGKYCLVMKKVDGSVATVAHTSPDALFDYLDNIYIPEKPFLHPEDYEPSEDDLAQFWDEVCRLVWDEFDQANADRIEIEDVWQYAEGILCHAKTHQIELVEAMAQSFMASSPVGLGRLYPKAAMTERQQGTLLRGMLAKYPDEQVTAQLIAHALTSRLVDWGVAPWAKEWIVGDHVQMQTGIGPEGFRRLVQMDWYNQWVDRKEYLAMPPYSFVIDALKLNNPEVIEKQIAHERAYHHAAGLPYVGPVQGERRNYGSRPLAEAAAAEFSFSTELKPGIIKGELVIPTSADKMREIFRAAEPISQGEPLQIEISGLASGVDSKGGPIRILGAEVQSVKLTPPEPTISTDWELPVAGDYHVLGDIETEGATPGLTKAKLGDPETKIEKLSAWIYHPPYVRIQVGDILGLHQPSLPQGKPTFRLMTVNGHYLPREYTNNSALKDAIETISRCSKGLEFTPEEDDAYLALFDSVDVSFVARITRMLGLMLATMDGGSLPSYWAGRTIMSVSQAFLRNREASDWIQRNIIQDMLEKTQAPEGKRSDITGTIASIYDELCGEMIKAKKRADKIEAAHAKRLSKAWELFALDESTDGEPTEAARKALDDLRTFIGRDEGIRAMVVELSEDLFSMGIDSSQITQLNRLTGIPENKIVTEYIGDHYLDGGEP